MRGKNNILHRLSRNDFNIFYQGSAVWKFKVNWNDSGMIAEKQKWLDCFLYVKAEMTDRWITDNHGF